MTMDDLLQVVPQLISRMTKPWKTDFSNKPTDNGKALVKFSQEREEKSRCNPLASLVQGRYSFYTKEEASLAEAIRLILIGEKRKETKTTKRLKDDEAKDAEPAKKSGKRRKQMARKGLHTDLYKDDYEGQ
ncbi:hypothetical protein Tco_0272123 [Tanacetum coccineum]